MSNTSFNHIQSVWKRWMQLAENQPESESIIHWMAGMQPFRWTYSSLISKANKYSNHFLNAGIKQGEVCAIILRHNPELYPIYLGIAGIGALPAVLAYPNPRLHPDKFRQGIVGMSQRSGLDWVLTDNELDLVIRPLITNKESTIKDIIYPLDIFQNTPTIQFFEVENIRNNFNRNDPFLLQHSSGTTGLQKPVLLSNRAVLDHIINYGNKLSLSGNDKIVSWLPLYHDMGLIAAFHLPLAFGIPSVQIDPFEWVLAPHLLLEAISRESGTITLLPNFAYNVLADKIHDTWIEGINLESLRMVINCSEPIRHYSHKKFYDRYCKYGLKENALSSSYAMAETTFAVTQNPPDQSIKEVIADRNYLAKGVVKLIDDEIEGRVCVSSGSLIDGCEIKIVDNNRQKVKSSVVGEIAIKSVSMFDGYRNYPEKTAEVLNDGWYYSGDYGFEIGEDLYVIGRKKDIIIVAGKNVYPEDIEDFVSQIGGVIPGRVIAFGEDNEDMGTEQISVIIETNYQDEADKNGLIKRVKQKAMELDLTVSNIYLVPQKWLIKSSAGKPSRNANKQRILEQKSK